MASLAGIRPSAALWSCNADDQCPVFYASTPFLVHQAQTLWSLYEKVRPSSLRLTKLDDEIYADMEETFPDLRASEEDKVGGVDKIDEERMKSEAGKKKWRDFIAKYEGKGASHSWTGRARQKEYGRREVD